MIMNEVEWVGKKSGH